MRRLTTSLFSLITFDSQLTTLSACVKLSSIPNLETTYARSSFKKDASCQKIDAKTTDKRIL